MDRAFGCAPSRYGHHVELVSFPFFFGCAPPRISWRAYGPGEVQILVSSDGGNFEEASCWRAATRSEVAYRETIMFGSEQKVKAVSIVMKSPMPWGYFGLNDVTLLTSGEESFMIVGGDRSNGAEQCLTVVGSEIVIDSCLDALAALDGREVFRFQQQRLVHVASGLCVAAAGDNTFHVELQDCAAGSVALAVRSVWQVTSNAQLKLPRMGNSCLTQRGGRPIVGECGMSSDRFFLAVVPEANLNDAFAVRSSAKLLIASAARQRSALNDLRALAPIVDSCRFVSLAMNSTETSRLYNAKLSRKGDSTMAVAGEENFGAAVLQRVYVALGVETDEVLKLISDSSRALSEMRAKFSVSA